MSAKWKRMYKNGTQIEQKFTSLFLYDIESDRVVLRDFH